MTDFNSTKYKNEFTKQNYDRLNIQVPKGRKAIIEAHWKSKGYKSLNAYVNSLIDRDMEAAGEKQRTNIVMRDNKGNMIVGNVNGNVHM